MSNDMLKNLLSVTHINIEFFKMRIYPYDNFDTPLKKIKKYPDQ